jgi:hypothetical protein
MSKPRNVSTRSSSVKAKPFLTADENGVAASQGLYEQGMRLWRFLDESQLRTGLVGMLRAARFLPMSGHPWRSVMEVGFERLCQSWVYLPSVMTRHKGHLILKLIPGVWMGQVDQQGYKDFCRLKGSDFVQRLAEELKDKYLPHVMRDEEQVFAALASRWMGQMPPISFSYLGFRSDMGSASSIDLSSMTIVRARRVRRVHTEMDQMELAMTKVLSQIRASRGRTRIVIKSALSAAEKSKGAKIDPMDTRWLVFKNLLLSRTMPKVAREFPKRNRNKRKRQPSSILRMAGPISQVSRLISTSKGDPSDTRIVLKKIENTVLSHFIEMMDDLEFTREEIKRFKLSSVIPRRKIALRRPAAYQAYYGLEENSFEPAENMVRAARRIVSNSLHYGGRRVVCSALMTIGDLRIGGVLKSNENETIFARFTKTRSAWNSWHAIAFLWPDAEIEFLRKFMLACENQDVPNSWQLLQVARLGFRSEENDNGPYTKITADLAQLRVRDGLVPGTRLATHLGRFAFASYWTLRVLATEYPFLLETDLYSQLRDHFWFQKEGLLKLKRLINGNPHHHLSVAAAMMGLNGPEQYISTYNRGQALELMAIQEILKARSAVHGSVIG